MYLASLGLEHFRCYERVEVGLGPGLIILVGGNASGKTSLLEAIHLLAVTKSQRTPHDRELIQWSYPWGRAWGTFVTDQRTLRLRVTLQQRSQADNSDERVPRKSVELDGVPRRRLADIVGQTAVIAFGPDDLNLVKGPPALRRRFLNESISQVRPAYLADLLRYRQALRQRNSALRGIAERTHAPESLPGWDVPLSEAGARIAAARAEFGDALDRAAQPLHHELSGGQETIEIAYTGDLAEGADVAERQATMRELLRAHRERDVALGRTARGPHRDELQVRVHGRSLRRYGSQGQQRTAALTLALAAAAVVTEWRADPPILLLDDCLSELDDERARRVLALCQRVDQVIVTAASWSPPLEEVRQGARVFEVRDHQVRELSVDEG